MGGLIARSPLGVDAKALFCCCDLSHLAAGDDGAAGGSLQPQPQAIQHRGGLVGGGVDPSVRFLPGGQAQPLPEGQHLGCPAACHHGAGKGAVAKEHRLPGVHQVAAAIAGGQDFPAYPVFLFNQGDTEAFCYTQTGGGKA